MLSMVRFSGSSGPKVCLHHGAVGLYLRRGAFADRLAMIQNLDPLAKLHDEGDVVLDDEDAAAELVTYSPNRLL